MYARVPQAMAQFVLKIEKLSHIMAPTPILEMARAYGLHPRLWLLVIYIISSKFNSAFSTIGKATADKITEKLVGKTHACHAFAFV